MLDGKRLSGSARFSVQFLGPPLSKLVQISRCLHVAMGRLRAAMQVPRRAASCNHEQSVLKTTIQSHATTDRLWTAAYREFLLISI